MKEIAVTEMGKKVEQNSTQTVNDPYWVKQEMAFAAVEGLVKTEVEINKYEENQDGMSEVIPEEVTQLQESIEKFKRFTVTSNTKINEYIKTTFIQMAGKNMVLVDEMLSVRANGIYRYRRSSGQMGMRYVREMCMSHQNEIINKLGSEKAVILFKILDLLVEYPDQFGEYRKDVVLPNIKVISNFKDYGFKLKPVVINSLQVSERDITFEGFNQYDKERTEQVYFGALRNKLIARYSGVIAEKLAEIEVEFKIKAKEAEDKISTIKNLAGRYILAAEIKKQAEEEMKNNRENNGVS